MNFTCRMILLSFISTASFSSALITPALPHIAHLFHVGLDTTTNLVSIFLLGYVIGQLIYGPLANRFGRLKALRAGFIINLLGICLGIAAIYCLSMPLLIIARFITAIGASSGLVCTFILIREYFNEKDAQHMLSFAVLSFTLGVGIAVLTGGFLVQYYGVLACFELLFAYGIFSLLGTLFFQETLQSPTPLNMRHLIKAYSLVLKEKRVVYFSMVLALCSSINYCYSTASPIIAKTVLGLSASQYGMWNGFNIVGMVMSSMLASSLLKNHGAEKVIKGCFLGLGACLVAFGILAYFTIQSPLIYFSASFVLYLMSGMFFPSASFCASKAYDQDKASAASIISFINMGTACLMVVVMGMMPFKLLNSMIVTLVLFLILLIFLPLKWPVFNMVPKQSI